MRVLVVEDDKDLRTQTVRALSEAAYSVDQAGDGEEAQFLGDSEPYDAIILDLGLPKVDGVKMGVNYGGNKTRFISPVKSGERIRGHRKLVDLTEKRPGQWQQTSEITIEIEGEDKPALITEWIMQFFV